MLTRRGFYARFARYSGGERRKCPRADTPGTNESGRWGPYRQASPPPARHRPGERSARREGRLHSIADHSRESECEAPHVPRIVSIIVPRSADRGRGGPHLFRRGQGPRPSAGWQLAIERPKLSRQGIVIGRRDGTSSADLPSTNRHQGSGGTGSACRAADAGASGRPVPRRGEGASGHLVAAQRCNRRRGGRAPVPGGHGESERLGESEPSLAGGRRGG